MLFLYFFSSSSDPAPSIFFHFLVLKLAFFLLFKEWFFLTSQSLCQVQTSLKEFPFVQTLPTNDCIIHESLPLIPSHQKTHFLIFLSLFLSSLSHACSFFTLKHHMLGVYSKYKGSLYKSLRDTPEIAHKALWGIISKEQHLSFCFKCIMLWLSSQHKEFTVNV